MVSQYAQIISSRAVSGFRDSRLPSKLDARCPFGLWLALPFEIRTATAGRSRSHCSTSTRSITHRTTGTDGQTHVTVDDGPRCGRHSRLTPLPSSRRSAALTIHGDTPRSTYCTPTGRYRCRCRYSVQAVLLPVRPDLKRRDLRGGVLGCEHMRKRG